jgi:photosystem II stability/assembly factor-like uncharacterized protein
LELSSVSSAGSKLFVAGNIHSADTTLYSVLLRSSDGGASWKDAVERARGEVLDHIQFRNFQVGWVSGQRVVPLPGDPFLMVTHDGGETWRKSFVLPEGSPGIVQKFGFRSETDGRILIDSGKGDEDAPQYRLFETKDSGDTWSKVEASDKPIRDAPAQEEDSLWRLRPDKGGKRVLLEHQAAGGWVSAAAFTIQIGECRER